MPLDGHTHKRIITRHRDHLSCIECRRKKLKCDRAAPCSACTKRDGGISCSYQRSTTGFEVERDRRRKAEGRLEHLEQLVQELSRSGQSGGSSSNGTGPSPAVTTGEASSSPGIRDSDAGAVSEAALYNSGTHWSAMLEDIEELKTAFSSSTDGSGYTPQARVATEKTGFDHTGILFGSGTPSTMEQILSRYLPERQEADRLVATYFRSAAVKAPYIHPSQFKRLYLDFWASPVSTSPLWISILFTVLHATTTSLSVKVVADNRYAIAAAHCLVAGKYHQPRVYAVEALLLYAQVHCFTSLDISGNLGSVFALVTRNAIRMGYHRDPSRLPISPFEREMKRRVWSSLLQLELLLSFQLGLQSSILPGSHDTRLPANLKDADFDESVAEMPPERPDTEETDIMFYIAKHRLSSAFEKVHQHVSRVAQDDSSAEFAIKALDGEIRQTYLALPILYRQKPVSESTFDSPTLIVARFCVNMIYEKCICVLHRPYVAAGRRESVLACYTSSRNMLSQFVDAYDEFQPGGQVEMQRWFMSAITWHDFLLGATAMSMVLCSASQHQLFFAIDARSAVSLLERSRSVLAQHSAQSRDTLQVQKVVQTVLARFEGMVMPSSGVPSSGSEGTGSSPSIQQKDASTNGSTNGSMAHQVEPSMDFDWAATFSQPMIDESWNWLEQMLADDSIFGPLQTTT